MRTISLILITSAALACRTDKDTPVEDDSGGSELADVDGDGFYNDVDCDDEDDTINPYASEVCDDIDNDCDGLIDDDDDTIEGGSTWYSDADGDGYGDANSSSEACDQPSGLIEDSSDCDDLEGSINPGADELCDEIDNDCDDEVDEDDAVDATTWYPDGDGDGYGVEEGATTSCEAPSGTVAADKSGFDCDDTDPAFHPGADEDDCTDPTDYNCDGSVAFEDTDGDGWPACEECDDSNAEINPDATEVCDEVDNDCDGDSDEDDAEDALTWYADADSDGFGDADSTTAACEAPSGYLDDDTDCDDDDSAVNPDATELCDEVDNDCDGDIDEDDAEDAATWYADADSDGYGDADSTTAACEAPSGYLDDDTDCDDDDSTIYPGATELCDEVDNDCDGDTDEDDAEDALAWYLDSDGDGFGDADSSEASCDVLSGYVEDDTDCDDDDSAVNPDAEEICDEIDNDCDGDIDTDDDGVTDSSSWYADSDGDGFGDADNSMDACEQPTDYVSDATDCDDADDEVNTDATEVCDSADNDCDGDIDDDDADVSDQSTWYVDKDSDGFGDEDFSTDSCDQPTGYVDDSTDCDDDDIAVNTDASEVCDEVDNDCDGDIDDDDSDISDQTTWYADKDSDGYGDADFSIDSCEQPTGYESDGSDCDDDDSSINPGELEVCNDGLDNDCDGTTGTTDTGASCELSDGSLSDSNLILQGTTASDVAGSALAWLGDVDGDGTDDFAVGAPYEDTAASAAGSTYVITNFELGLTDNETKDLADSKAQITGISAADHSGQSLGAGDMNGDGYGDIWIGAPREDTGGNGAGSAYLVLGPLTTASTDLASADETFNGASAKDYFGWGLDASGDVDGDGCADALLSAPQDSLASGAASASPTGGGETYLYTGSYLYSSDCKGDPVSAMIYSNTSGDASGYSLGFMDTDGDGLSEIIIGAPDSDLGPAANSGAAYLLSGSVSGSVELGTDMVTFGGEAYNDRAGWDVAGNGDVNADGYDDLFISAEQEDDGGSNAGSTYLFLGPISITETEFSMSDADAQITGAESGDRSGYALSYAGDIDGDGNDEILIGAWKADGDSAASGVVHMLMGPITGSVNLADADATFAGVGAGDQVGAVIAGGGDFDGDGTPDILIGGRKSDDGASGAGAAYLILGLSQ